MSDTPIDQRKHYSVWLCPDDPPTESIRSTIDQLALRHASLPFEPHMTVCSGLTDEQEEIESKLIDFAGISKPLFLYGVKFSYRPMFYQSLFIELKLDGTLKRFHKDALQALGQTPAKDFYPHMSLAYIDPSEFEPTVEISRLNKHLLLKTRYNRLKLMETSGYQKDWKEVIEVELNGR